MPLIRFSKSDHQSVWSMKQIPWNNCSLIKCLPMDIVAGMRVRKLWSVLDRSLLNSHISELSMFFCCLSPASSSSLFLPLYEISWNVFICKYHASPRTICVSLSNITLKWTANEPSEQWTPNRCEQEGRIRWRTDDNNNDSGWKCVYICAIDAAS